MSHHVHAASPAHPTRASARGSGASRQPRSSRPAAAQNVSTTQTEVDLVDELRTEPDAVDVLRAITDEALRYDGDDGGLLADVDAASPLDIHFGSPFYLRSAREDLVRGVGAPLARRFVAETADEDRIWRPSLDAYTVNEVLDDEEVLHMDRHGLTHVDVMRVDEGADAEDARVQQRLRNIKARLESAVQWEVDGSGEADTAALTSSSSSSSDDAAIERNIHQFLRADGVALPREMRSCGDGGVGEDDAAAQNFSAHDFAMDLLYRSVGGLDDDGRGEDVGSEIHLNAEHLQPKGPIGRGGLLEELASNYCAMLAKDADAIPDVSQWATHHRGCPSMAEVGMDGVSPLEVRRLLAFSVSANPHLRHHLREAAATAPLPQPIDDEPRAEHTLSTASPPMRCKAPVHPPTAEQSATLLAQQQQLVEKVIAALPRVAPDLTEELARQRRLLEHLTQVQQEHLRRLRHEQQAETQARIVAPAYNAAMTAAGAHHAEPRRVFGDVGASSMMQQQQQQQPTRQRVSFAHDDVHAPPLIISTAASAPPQPASAAAVAMLEREATYYEKELYRVKDDHQHQLSYERQRRQVEHRAFAEALQQQQRDLTRAHKESIDLLRRDARLKHSEDQHLIERLTAAQGMAHARWEEKQQQRHEASTQRMLDRAVDDIKRVATPSGVSAPQLSSPPTTRRRPISARRGAPPPRKAPRTSSTAAEVEAKEEKEEEEVDVEEVRERTSSEKNVSPSLADATAMPSSVAPPTPLAVVDAASVAGDAASTSSSPYDGAKPMIDRHFRGRIQARLPPEDGDVPSLLPHGLISATKAPAQRKPTQARSSKTGVVASADAAKRLYPYKTQQPRTPATTTRKKPVVSQPKSNTRGEKLREDQRRGTSSTHHQRPMLTPSALRKDGFHHHEEHSIASSHQHQSVQPPQWMYTEQMELSESDGHSIVEQMDLHHRSRIASAAAVGPMMCFVVEQSQAREMARLPTSQVAAEAFRRTQRGGAYPLPVEEPPAGQLLYDHYSLGEEMDGIYTRRWRETQEAADAVRAAEMELRRQRISTSVGADDANYINGAPHVKEMHRVQTGADQAQVKMVDVHEDETLADDARRMTYITPAMAAEARTLREARERLAHLQEIMIRPSSIQHLHDRVVGDEGIMKDVRDRLVSETIYSILGEATEASLFDDVVNALHAEMISAILQHEVLTHAPPPPSQASLMREELDGRLHDHLARAMLEELLADATLLENIPDVAAEDDVEEMHADVLKHHVEVVGEREAMLNALEKVLMGYEGGAARHDDDGDDDDDGRGSSVVEGGAVMHAAMRREVVRVPSVSLVPSISPRRRGAVEDSGIISASLNAPATTAAPATTTHSPRPSRIPVEVCAAADGATTTLAAIETTTTTANDDGNGCIRLVLDLQPMLDHHRDRYRPPPMMSEQTRRTTTNESGAEEDLRDVIVEETRLVRRAALATTPEVAATNFGMISPQTITTTTATTVLDAQAASLMQLHHAQAEMMVRAVCEMEQLQRTAVVEQEALQHDCLLTRLQYLQPMMMASNTTHIHATSSPPSMVAPSADASRHSPPTAPPAMGSATSLVHAAEDAAARTHAVDDVRRAGRPPTTIRDPVTRFIFEWLQEFGDGGAPPPPTMAEELHRAAMMAELQPHVSPQDEEGEGHHRRHRTHRHHDDGSSGSILATSSLLTSTDSSSSPDVHRRICRGSRLLGSPTPQPYPARLHDVRHDGQHSSTTRYTTTAGTTRTTSNSASPSCDVLGIPLPRRSPSATVTTNTTRTSTTNQERMIHAVEEEGEESTNHDEGRGSESSMAALRARYDALMRGGVVRSAAAMDDAPPSREAVAAHHGYMELLATHVHDVQARGRTPTTCAYRMFDGPTLTTLTSAPVVMSRGDAATIEDPLRWRDDPPS